MTHKISIDDLSEPVLSETQKAALAFCEGLDITLDRQEILDEASRAVGLDDFGNEDFIDRLDLLISEWREDSELTKLGKLSLRNKLLLYAKNRLLIENTLKKHPEILDIEIKNPIIVAGLPRSGTTHLLNLLAADSRFRSLALWESFEPLPLPGEVPTYDNNDPRFKRCDSQWKAMQQMVPLLAAMHPMNPEHIHEEIELMGPTYASYNFEWLHHSPRWRDAYFKEDQTPHYQYMKNVLKILTWQKGPGRWVLKCPQHLEQLPVLQRIFPDATFVITHRDPVSVIQSAITMLAYGQRINKTRVDVNGLLRYWTDRIEHLLQACVKERDCLPAQQSIDVLFHEFMSNDIKTVEQIYEKAGIEMNGQAREELMDYIKNHPRGKHGQIVYELERHFGISPEKLRERFRFYFEHFPVQPEGAIHQ